MTTPTDLSALFEAFEEALIQQDVAPLTRQGYLHDLALFARWFEQRNLRPLTADNLTPSDVRAYRLHLFVDERRKPSTVNRRLAALRSFGLWIQDAELVSYNPVNGIKGVEEEELAPRWLDKKAQAALLREAERRIQAARPIAGRYQAIRDHAILVLLLNTGLRRSELLALQIDDLTCGERKGELRVQAGKGSKSRTIPLNNTARKALRSWLAVRPNLPSRVVFTGQRGPLKRSSYDVILKDLARAAEVEGVTLHVLRHTFAKNLVDSGASLEKVAKLLGHANLNTTKVYVTPSQDDLDRAVRALDD